VLTVLWGVESDEPLAMVYEALRDRGGQVLLVDQRRVTETDFRVEDEENLRGFLRYGNQLVALESITGWYVRPYDTRRVPAIERAGPTSKLWQHALELEDALLGWFEMTAALMVNRPSSMLANGCKPYQLQMIARAGFAIPETLVTTDPAEVIAFRERHGQVIYKSISGVRSRVTRLSEKDHERLKDVGHCPTQFQAYIPGRDYRVHVVGENVFACEVESDADDYRYGGDGPRIRAVRLPRDLEELATAMTRSMGLNLAGIDLRCTPQGQWYCFEVNPSPGFTFYENVTGQGIAGAIAQLLMSSKDQRQQSVKPVTMGGDHGTETSKRTCLAGQGR
jgi:ribosomal protein S6-L-glutamate ligase RimK-like protein